MRTEADVEKLVQEEYRRIVAFGAPMFQPMEYHEWHEYVWGLANHLVRNRLQVEDALVLALVAATVPEPRKVMSCRYCGAFSSAQQCGACIERLAMMPGLVRQQLEIQIAVAPHSKTRPKLGRRELDLSG